MSGLWGSWEIPQVNSFGKSSSAHSRGWYVPQSRADSLRCCNVKLCVSLKFQPYVNKFKRKSKKKERYFFLKFSISWMFIIKKFTIKLGIETWQPSAKSSGWFLFWSLIQALKPKFKPFRIPKKCYFPSKFVDCSIIFAQHCTIPEKNFWEKILLKIIPPSPQINVVKWVSRILGREPQHIVIWVSRIMGFPDTWPRTITLIREEGGLLFT